MKEVKLSNGCVVKKDGEFLVFYGSCWTIPIPVETLREYYERVNQDANIGFFYNESIGSYSLTHHSGKMTISTEDFQSLKELIM